MEHVELELAIGLVALAVAAYALIAARLSKWSVSAAFSFLAIGTVIGWLATTMGAESMPGHEILGSLAELTLALVLFAAASTVSLKRLESDTRSVLRLLAIGLPLTIAIGTVMALGFFPGISFGVALLIGTVLAPTDADLGHQVISGTSVPARIRRMLNVESGLNDGIAAPVVTVAIALAVFGDVHGMSPVIDAVGELAVAAVVGVTIGGVGRWLLSRADIRKTATPSSRQLATLALAMAAYLLAAGLGASGFIAAFVAGLAFGLGSKKRVESAVGFTEAQSVLLSIIVWLVLGLTVVGENLAAFGDPVIIAYAVLALTAMRMIPVAIALLGSGFDRVTVAFMGWFGPRGLASVVFVLIGLEALDSAGLPTDPLGPVVAWTVVLSVIAHGFSAKPLARLYGRYAQGLPDDAPERVGDSEPRRRPWRFHDHGSPRV